MFINLLDYPVHKLHLVMFNMLKSMELIFISKPIFRLSDISVLKWFRCGVVEVPDRLRLQKLTSMGNMSRSSRKHLFL